MIDNPDQVDRLIPKLEEALPVCARLSSQLVALVREQAPGLEVPQRCAVTRIDYAGDQGGIMCRLELGGREELRVFFVSITHLTFDRRQPLAREIAAYQRHRTKRIRRAQGWLTAA